MRLPSRARSALAVVGVSLFSGGCTPDYVHAEGVDFGYEGEARTESAENAAVANQPTLGILAQQVPPGFESPRPGEVELQLPPADETAGRHAFYWTRAIYSGSRGGYWGGRSRGAWATDFPKGDRQFLVVLERLVRVDAYDAENAIHLADPNLRRFPVIYAVEVGYMDLTPEEIHGLRDYLNAGGFLIVDDFWGSYEWAQFEYNMRQVLPGRPIVDLPLDHPIFTTYYEIDEIKQVPARGRGIRGRPTWEADGVTPHVRGIFDDNGELMVVINWNTDLGDAWEWAEDPMYPLEYSTYAFEIGANMIVYGMSH